jgi:hypothetical protein
MRVDVMFYQKYKLYIWITIFFLTGSGAVSNYYNGLPFEVWLNGILAGIALIVCLILLMKKR